MSTVIHRSGHDRTNILNTQTIHTNQLSPFRLSFLGGLGTLQGVSAHARICYVGTVSP